MEKYLEKGRFRRILFHKFLASYGKVPKKGRFFGGYFFLKILAFQGKVTKKADFFQIFFRILSHGFFGKFIFKEKKAKIWKFF